MNRKHGTIEQLDGNTSFYDVGEKVDEEVKHFLQYGFLRDPNMRVPPNGDKLWVYISEEMQKCGLSKEERCEEYKLMNIYRDTM